MAKQIGLYKKTNKHDHIVRWQHIQFERVGSPPYPLRMVFRAFLLCCNIYSCATNIMYIKNLALDNDSVFA